MFHLEYKILFWTSWVWNTETL